MKLDLRSLVHNTIFIGLIFTFDSCRGQDVTLDNNIEQEPFVVTPEGADPGIMMDANSQREAVVNEFMEEIAQSHYTSSTGFTYTQSLVHTMNLAHLDKRIYLHLKAYSESLKERLDLVESYMKDFERHTVNENLDLTQPDLLDWDWASGISTNPITAFQLIRRMSMALPSVLQNIESGRENDLMDQIYQSKGKLEWLSSQDIELAMESILEIQNTYDLNVAQFSNGIISHGNITTSASLTGRQCYEIGSYAFGTNRLASAIEWMDAAWKKYFSHNDESISMDNLLEDMNIVISKHDEELKHYLESGQSVVGSVHPDLFRDNVISLKTFDKQKLRHLPEAEAMRDPQLRFWNMCAGKKYQLPSQQRLLHCKYVRTIHPYWTINPLKIEILNLNPELIQVHDIIGAGTGTELVIHAFSILEAYFDAETKAPVPAVIWETPEFSGLTSSLEYLTQKQVVGPFSADVLHVTGYSFGSSDNSNDRPVFPEIPTLLELEAAGLQHEQASVQIFLNKPLAGGWTVFPNLELAIIPSPRSAVFWYTVVEEKYHEDLRVKNCPVILGTKWVASKYIREVGEKVKQQFFRKPFTTKKRVIEMVLAV